MLFLHVFDQRYVIYNSIDAYFQKISCVICFRNKTSLLVLLFNNINTNILITSNHHIMAGKHTLIIVSLHIKEFS